MSPLPYSLPINVRDQNFKKDNSRRELERFRETAKMRPMTMGRMWATMGSSFAGFLFMWAMIMQYLPSGFKRYVDRWSNRLINYVYPYVIIAIHESNDRLKRTEAYGNVEAYLSANAAKNAKRLRAETSKKNSMVLSMDGHETLTDVFNGTTVWWSLRKTSPGRSMFQEPEPEKRYFTLSFHKRYRELVIDSYLAHVMKEGKAIRVRNRQRKLFTNSSGHKWSSMWSHIVFEHPATFETLAMDPEKKREIVDDLLTFQKGKEYYAKIGKVWKRGYLLYGPPGTGKSTMIAAMAKLLDYDVYDLELTAVKDNTELRKLLIEVSKKSILVVEDIDCSLDLTGQRNKNAESSLEDDGNEGIKESTRKESKDESSSSSSKVTLSGLLNVIDGLWSACREERLIVFTTNYVEKLDPALIRRGRMDKHIKLSYCNFEAFKVLAKNYLDIDSHPLFEAVQKLLDVTQITPADAAENLMPKSSAEDAEICLSNLIQALEEAKEEGTRTKAIEDLKAEVPAKQDAAQLIEN